MSRPITSSRAVSEDVMPPPQPHACGVHHEHVCGECGRKTPCCQGACELIVFGKCLGGCVDPLASKPYGNADDVKVWR